MRLARDGFAVLPGVFSAGDVQRMLATFDEAMGRLDRPIGTAWFPTILLPEEPVREFVTTELAQVFASALHDLLVEGETDLMRIDFSVKPASPDSGLGPHQDFSLVDERLATSLYLWAPLVDVDDHNGTLHAVRGSHHFANRIRAQHVPARFDQVIELVESSADRLDCQAGDLVVMVAGVVHYSGPNMSDRTRVAAHAVVTPSSTPLLFFYADQDTPTEKVEAFEVDIDQYVKLIRSGRPRESATLAGLFDRPPIEMTPDRFARGLAERAEA
jgi:hypothetical protein